MTFRQTSLSGVFEIHLESNLVHPLPHQRQTGVPNATTLPGIAEMLSEFSRKSMALIEGTQGQKSGIGGDLPAGKIGADGLMTVEGEVQL